MDEKKVTPINIENIPEELKLLDRWVLWGYQQRDGKWSKPLFRAADFLLAAVNKPNDWSSFNEAVIALYRFEKAQGLGFVLVEDDGLIAWDLDHCVNKATGEIVSPEARDIVETVKSYTEITPSLEGIRILSHGTLPPGRNRIGQIEVYSHGRYVTITGNTLPLSPSRAVEPREEQNLVAYAKYLRGREDSTFERVLTADAKIRKLFDGDWSADFPSHSEADFDLCVRLLQHGNVEEVDGWFRRSKLMRKKWDEKHGDQTYGEITLAKAAEFAKKVKAEAVHNTDLGNAIRLKVLGQNRARWCQDWGNWYVSNDVFWEKDGHFRIHDIGREVIQQIAAEAANMNDSDGRKAMLKHAVATEGFNKLSAMIKLARAELSITPEEFDSHPELLNLENGTLELLEERPWFKFREHRIEDYITRAAPVLYEPDSPDDLWYSFLNDITDGSQELADFLQRVVGYSMTGINTEHKLFFFYGHGRNGKTTFADAIKSVMGRYAGSLDNSIITMNKYDPHPTGIAGLKGLHLAVVAEVDDSRRLNEILLKSLTGGDPISARHMREDYFEFYNRAKIWMYGNFKPSIRAWDKAIWDRMIVVPFEHTFTEEERDPEMLAKLELEKSGIFNWMLEGYMAWRKEGLNPPQVVSEAVEDYREEQDIMQQFVDEHIRQEAFSYAYTDTIYRVFVKFCEARGERPGSSRAMTEQLKRMGFKIEVGAANRKRLMGVRLVDDRAEM